MLSDRWRTSIVLVLLCVLCASANLTKPVHIDDTAYLEIAQAILEDPFHPLSSRVNWYATARPAARLNQPILSSYTMAAVMLLFGPSELALHGLMALVASIATLFFFFLVRLLGGRDALFATALFVLSPAFLPGQNLMHDVPLVAAWLVFFWAVLSASRGTCTARLAIAATMIGVACLIKYTSLVLLPIFLFAILLRRQWHALWLLVIPVAFLIGWSIFNVLDYGSVHIIERGIQPLSTERLATRAVEWITALGAAAPFSVFLLGATGRRQMRGWIIAGSGLLGVVMFLAARSVVQFQYVAVLWALFSPCQITRMQTSIGSTRHE